MNEEEGMKEKKRKWKREKRDGTRSERQRKDKAKEPTKDLAMT